MEAIRKLELKWMGPFLEIEKTRPGSFRSADTKGRELENSWNAENLHRLYV
jgi:hypothetical protein